MNFSEITKTAFLDEISSEKKKRTTMATIAGAAGGAMSGSLAGSMLDDADNDAIRKQVRRCYLEPETWLEKKLKGKKWLVGAAIGGAALGGLGLAVGLNSKDRK